MRIYLIMIFLFIGGCQPINVDQSNANTVINKSVFNAEDNLCNYDTVSLIGTQSIIESCSFANVGDKI